MLCLTYYYSFKANVTISKILLHTNVILALPGCLDIYKTNFKPYFLSLIISVN